MKIALCLSSLPLSGVGTSTGIIFQGLLNAGHDVNIIITSDKQGDDFNRAKNNGWPVFAICKGIRFLKDRLTLTLGRLSSYDVVINNDSLEPQLIFPFLPEHIFRIAVMRNLNVKAISLISMNSEYLDAVVAISKEMKDILSKNPNILCPVQLISNCTMATSSDIKKLSLPLKISFVGRLSEKQKNILIIPEIIQYLQKAMINLSFTIAGDGPERIEFEKKCKKLNVWQNVKMLGTVSRKEAQDVIKESHFTVMPSYFEGLSNVMLESMALGCLPITSNIKNFNWVLGKASSKLQMETNNAKEYSDRIIDLANDNKNYDELLLYLRERQQKQFTPDSTIKGYLNLFKKLSSGKIKRKFKQIQFNKLSLPFPYNLQCSMFWCALQLIKDLQRNMTSRFSHLKRKAK